MTVPKTGSDGFDQNRTPVPPITILQGVGAMFEGKKKKTLPYTRGEIVALCIIKYYLEPREREKKLGQQAPVHPARTAKTAKKTKEEKTTPNTSGSADSKKKCRPYTAIRFFFSVL